MDNLKKSAEEWADWLASHKSVTTDKINEVLQLGKIPIRSDSKKSKIFKLLKNSLNMKL